MRLKTKLAALAAGQGCYLRGRVQGERTASDRPGRRFGRVSFGALTAAPAALDRRTHPDHAGRRHRGGLGAVNGDLFGPEQAACMALA